VTNQDYVSYSSRVNKFIQEIIPSDTINLHEAMQYSTNSGKRLRPILSYLVGEHLALDSNTVDAVAASIELIHCYSLIHDDLPCMDDDDLRRGKPTTHIKYSEATALLAGDALQSLAFEILSDPYYISDNIVSNHNKIVMIRTLASAIGARGMVLGQQLDLNSEDGLAISIEELKNLHNLKTGQLFKAALVMPCYCQIKIPEPNLIHNLEKLSYHLGIAFQIQDDLLDVSDASIIGKSSGSDQRNSKTTYLTLLGQQRAEDELEKELAMIAKISSSFPNIANFISTVISRRNY